MYVITRCYMYIFDNETDANLSTLACLIDQKVITNVMSLKMGNSGLELKHLKVAHDRGSLAKVLSEKSKWKT